MPSLLPVCPTAPTSLPGPWSQAPVPCASLTLSTAFPLGRQQQSGFGKDQPHLGPWFYSHFVSTPLLHLSSHSVPRALQAGNSSDRHWERQLHKHAQREKKKGQRQLTWVSEMLQILACASCSLWHQTGEKSSNKAWKVLCWNISTQFPKGLTSKPGKGTLKQAQLEYSTYTLWEMKQRKMKVVQMVYR